MTFRGGNLYNHFCKWKEIANNTTILQWVQCGVPLDFDVCPLHFEEKNSIFKKKECEFLDKEIPKLVQSGCIRLVKEGPRCVSRITTVPKQKGDFRLVTDLRQVNKCLKQNKSFVFENIDIALDLVEPSHHLVTLDIKNGFFHCKVDPKFHTFLGFSYRQKYVWQVLPSGSSVSPYYFCKILRAVVQHLRSNDIKTVCYVDDFLLTDNPKNIEHSKSTLLQVLQELGNFINFDESVLVPQFYAKFIGYEIHTNKKKDTVWVCIKKLKQDIGRVVKTGLVVARSLARITGQIVSMCKVLLAAKVLLTNIYRLLSSKTSWQHKLTVDRASLYDLEWWLEALDNWNGTFFRTEPKHMIQLTTDASGRSWGRTNVGTNHKAQRFWDKETNTLSSNAKELLAVLLTLKSLLHLVRQRSVQILSDSVTVCAMINFQGGAVRTLDILARNIWELAIRNNITIQAKHLAGKLNREADRLSRLPAQYEWHMHPKQLVYRSKFCQSALQNVTSSYKPHLPNKSRSYHY